MPLSHLFILLGTGLALGFLSGLLGIGGGIVMTPVQYWLYTSAGMSTDLAIKISFATTLAVILPTAASGVWQHQRKGSINWRAAVCMGVFTALGSFIGASLASHIPGSILKTAFGVLALLIVVRMLTVRLSESVQPIRQNYGLWIALALPIGLITGMLGIGGGIMVVPALVLLLHFCLRNAIGTSLAMMIFTSLGGIAGYVINGLQVSGLPAHTIGYIYWPAWLALSLTSIVTAQFGAIMAHSIPVKWLNYVFLTLISYVGLDMLGVIDWIISHL